MGLFDKNTVCSICGKSCNFLEISNTLKEGNVCSECAQKCSSLYKITRKSPINEVREHIRYREKNSIDFSKFSSTDKVDKFINVDMNLQKLYFPFINTKDKIPDLFDFSQIIDYELNEDGESITSKKVSIGKAAIGTVLLGPVGTIIGGLSGKSKSKSITNSMKIRISINSNLLYQVEIPLITKETKHKSSAYNSAQNTANKIISILDVITDIAKSNTNNNLSCQSKPAENNVSVADEINKLKKLLNDNIITQEEFDKAKQRLLK